MVEIVRSVTFDRWLSDLKDRQAVIRILARIDRLAVGNPGDVRPEMRIDHGPGYRVYYAQRGSVLIILLCGGDKSTQDLDIAHARVIAENWED